MKLVMNWHSSAALLLGLTSCGSDSVEKPHPSEGAPSVGSDGATAGDGRDGWRDGMAGVAMDATVEMGTSPVADVANSADGGIAASGVGNPCPMPTKPATGINIALHHGYAAGALNFQNPDNAFDGDLNTTSGTSIENDGVLAVDFGSVKALYRTVIKFSTATPQRYKIQGSDDASTWTDILRVNNPNYIDDRLLPSSNHRYLRMIDYRVAGLRGEEPSMLQPVNEIEVYEKGADDSPACAPIVYPSPIDRKAWIASSSNGGGAQGAVSSLQQGWTDPHGALDGPDHWRSQHLQVGTFVAVDMGSAQTFNQIVTSADHDAVQDYAIYVSDDGTSWGSPITSGTIVSTGGHPFAPFSFPTQLKRHFKIESRYVADFPEREWGYWNISALNASAQADDAVNIALNQPTTGSKVKNPSAVFDGDDATGADDAGLIQIDLGKPSPIGHINVKFAMTQGGFFYDIETSDEGTLWTARQKVFAVRNFRHPATNLIRGNYTTRYLRFLFQPSEANNAQVFQKVNEIEVYKPTAR